MVIQIIGAYFPGSDFRWFGFGFSRQSHGLLSGVEACRLTFEKSRSAKGIRSRGGLGSFNAGTLIYLKGARARCAWGSLWRGGGWMILRGGVGGIHMEFLLKKINDLLGSFEYGNPQLLKAPVPFWRTSLWQIRC